MPTVSTATVVVVPIPSVESQAGGYPVVYEAGPDEPPYAGPVYPGHGS